VDTPLKFHVISEEVGQRLDVYLQGKAPDLSRSSIRTYIVKGHVLVNQKDPKKAGYKVQDGDQIVLEIPPPPPMHATPEDIPLDICHEDDNLLVINKSPDMVVHPAPGHPGGTIVNGVLFHCGPITTDGDPLRPGIVHRLDKDTTGLMVVAKNDPTHKVLSEQLQKRDMTRIYFAIVMGARLDDSGTYSTQYGRHPNDRIKFSSRVQGGKVATTHWQLLASGALCALVAIRLETGRTHQIRVHFSDFGHPVAGDPLYGTSLKGFNTSVHPKEARALAQLPHQALHAGILGLRKPGDSEQTLYSVPPPAPFMSAVNAAFGEEACGWLSDPMGPAAPPGLDTLLHYG